MQSSSMIDSVKGSGNIYHVLAPGKPITVLLDPILTWVFPEIVPLTTMILGVRSFSFTAAVN
jgi:hypothetical protein